MNHHYDPVHNEESRFNGARDDVIIIPIVLAVLSVNKLLQLFFSILMRLLDFAFPIAMQIIWLPFFVAKGIGDVTVVLIRGSLRLLPLSESKRRQWSRLISRNWSWLRRKLSYRAFEQAVHIAFEGGMAWMFRKCRHLTPNTALLVILGAVIWLPLSFGTATAMHAILFAKLASWPAWMQVFHPLATVVAKSKLLVLPVYPAAWPQARKHTLVQFAFRIYQAIKRLYVIEKAGSRYRQAEIAGVAALEMLGRRRQPRIHVEVVRHVAWCEPFRRRKAHSQDAFFHCAMVN
ncbi:hypothetical protein [Bradyrhizobium sp. AUGA SZCCT0283]|uniref:hypothetical protein n=1 Tax=Bradyrhizobium sp. AUGA SZCCT0283 TaxID=2807671 RepID=UPI002011365C|nr:hypothetical protein [Bradyrhizobium sp. AUGA SZCCT0283]